MRIHSALPDALTAAIDAVLRDVEHVAHGAADPMRAAEAAASDTEALALLGPFRSREVAEVVEATAPAGLPLLAPVATWAGVTREDEPGCEDDPAHHRGTVLRIVARDTEVAARLAADVRAAGQRVLVVAGEHEYGVQLDGQLALAGLPRADRGRGRRPRGAVRARRRAGGRARRGDRPAGDRVRRRAGRVAGPRPAPRAAVRAGRGPHGHDGRAPRREP